MASPIDTRGTELAARMNALGITKSEFAVRADVNRGTIDRAQADDPRMTERTWAKIEKALALAEEEVGMLDSGHLVTTTIEINGAKVTVQGTPQDAAETVRKILERN